MIKSILRDKNFFSGLTKEKLTSLFSKKSSTEFSVELKAILLQDLSRQPSDIVTQLEYCVKTTWEWLGLKVTHHEQKESRTSHNSRTLSIDDAKPPTSANVNRHVVMPNVTHRKREVFASQSSDSFEELETAKKSFPGDMLFLFFCFTSLYV